MIYLYLVRHGETEYNRTYRYLGQGDLPLNETGIAQVASLKERLKQTIWDFACCSSLSRCRQTLSILNPEVKSPIIYSDSLKETHYGLLEGCTRQEYREKYPEEDIKYLRDHNSYVFPGGESYSQMYHRVTSFMENYLAVIKAQYNGQLKHHEDVFGLVVAHGGVICALISHFVFNNIECMKYFFIENASCQKLVFSDSRTTLWLS